MNTTVNVHEAKLASRGCCRGGGQGEEVVIAKAGRPVARLVPVVEKPKKRKPGSAKGRVWMADDFNDPLPEEIQKYFE